MSSTENIQYENISPQFFFIYCDSLVQFGDLILYGIGFIQFQ